MSVARSKTKQKSTSPFEHAVTRGLLKRIGDKWSVVVAFHLRAGSHRFSALEQELGITQRALVLTLRALERDGLVTRTMHLSIPPRVDYELTALGRQFLNKVMTFVTWAEVQRETIEHAQRQFDAKYNNATTMHKDKLN